uniref:EGF-like domain-containing protein n=1 Tax=Rhabditophanes sp. KR3021 TaxID=114890 RepID=A0AC35TIE7_9BILA
MKYRLLISIFLIGYAYSTYSQLNSVQLTKPITCYPLEDRQTILEFETINLNSGNKSFNFEIIFEKNKVGELGEIIITRYFEKKHKSEYILVITIGLNSINILFHENGSKRNLSSLGIGIHGYDPTLHILFDFKLNKFKARVGDESVETNLEQSAENFVNSEVSLKLGNHNEGNAFVGEVDIKTFLVDGQEQLLTKGIFRDGRCNRLHHYADNYESQNKHCSYSGTVACSNNGGTCKKDNENLEFCICATDYIGKYCQFTELPRSCAQIKQSYGVHKIDLDGGGSPEHATFVECASNSTTIVSHNLSPDTTIRGGGKAEGLIVNINYKLFNDHQLKLLIDRSAYCEQEVTYKCTGYAPLGFTKNLTWFGGVMSGLRIHSLNGKVEGECPCRSGGCTKEELVCNCHGSDGIDKGLFVNEQSGINEIVARIPYPVNDVTGLGMMTLGPLKCMGDKGHANDYSATFKKDNTFFEIEEHYQNHLEFQFRTGQKDINQFYKFTLLEEISLSNKDTSYVGFEKYNAYDVISSTVVLSFRTDQREGILFFTVDQNRNFLQIHLADEFNIKLTFNSGKDQHQCNIEADNDEFSNMEWHQLVLKSTNDKITLLIDNSVCTINIKRKLEVTPIPNFMNAFDNIVIPPIAPGQASTSDYSVIFVGGVPTRNNISPSNLGPIYTSSLPSLMGCFRGFAIDNNQLNLRTADLKTSDGTSVYDTCTVNCESVSCKNGGHCQIDWPNHRKESDMKPTCDCSKTSFDGFDCTQDLSIAFNGSEYAFSFLMNNIPDTFIWDESKLQVFSFSFATNKSLSDEQMIQLVSINFSNGKVFRIFVYDDNIRASYNRTPVIFNGHFNDGYRHFVQIIANQKSNTFTMIIDDQRKVLPFSEINFTKSENYNFGNVSTDISAQLGYVVPYEGYISNIDINYHKQAHYKPIQYLAIEESKYHKDILTVLPEGSTFQTSYRPEFKVIDVPAERQNTLEFPEWNEPLLMTNYIEDGQTDLPPDKHWWTPWLWAILLILLLVIILIIICCVGVCLKREPHVSSFANRPDYDKPKTSLPTNVTYIPMEQPTNSPQYHQSNFKENYVLPEPSEDLEQIQPLRSKESFDSLSDFPISINSKKSRPVSGVTEDGDDPVIRITDYAEDKNSMIYNNEI